jgi:hypothetical protein
MAGLNIRRGRESGDRLGFRGNSIVFSREATFG